MKFDPAEEIDNEKAHSIIREIVVGGEFIVSKHMPKPECLNEVIQHMTLHIF